MSVTREELRLELEHELARYPTKEDLKLELARYPTKEDLRLELARFATKEDLQATKDDLAGMRTHLVILIEDLKSTMLTLFDGLKGRLDAMEERPGSLIMNGESAESRRE
jgi:hypothetical protein